MLKTEIATSLASIMLLISLASTFTFGTTYAQSLNLGAPIPNNSNATSAVAAHPERFDAKQIYQTNNVTVIDPGIRNLAIIIPDNMENRSLWPTFLPANVTIAAGMRVIWFNADVNATHNIVVRNATGGILNSTTANIPYQNATVYRFGNAGTYTFSDPSAPNLKNGTINVVKPQSFGAHAFTNSSGTIGLFIVPAVGKPTFDPHMHKLGFNAVSTFNFTTFPNSAVDNSTAQMTIAGTAGTNGISSSGTKILYVWTQEASGIQTATSRIANKVRIIEETLYPHGMVKAQ
jgi:hypothetical protein